MSFILQFNLKPNVSHDETKLKLAIKGYLEIVDPYGKRKYFVILNKQHHNNKGSTFIITGFTELIRGVTYKCKLSVWCNLTIPITGSKKGFAALKSKLFKKEKSVPTCSPIDQNTSNGFKYESIDGMDDRHVFDLSNHYKAESREIDDNV